MPSELTVDRLTDEARSFSEIESAHSEPTLFGVTDGKAVGTYLEHKFRDWLRSRYSYEEGSSASGIDFPTLAVDMKVTSIRQPQSSCPFKSPRQKIYGLGYSLLIFVYDKLDDAATKTGRLDIRHTVFVDSARTADHQMTRGITQILESDGNEEDLISFMNDRLLPVDEIQAQRLAEEILRNRPELGYLTISNALQWRLQYKRVIDMADQIDGIKRIR